MKIFIMSLLFLVFLPFNAFANNSFYFCEEDSRPFDGDYQKISIVQNENGKHDVYHSFMSGGLFPEGHQNKPIQNELIAENLSCHMEILGIECYDKTAPKSLPILETQTTWINKDPYIEVIYNFKQIALFRKLSCH